MQDGFTLWAHQGSNLGPPDYESVKMPHFVSLTK